MKKFTVLARRGCADFYPPLILEEEFIVAINAKSAQDAAKKAGGRYRKIEGEECLFIPLKSYSHFLDFVDKNKGDVASFKKWWEKGTTVEINGKRGKLFIIKT
jgi:hypothetical protein